MSSRKEIQEAHEHDVIQQFVTWLNCTTFSHFRIKARPNPLDAVLCDGRRPRWVWVEHADIYHSGDEAREERTLAVSGEKDYFHTEHPIVEPDRRFASAFVETLGDKLQKSSYACAFEPSHYSTRFRCVDEQSLRSFLQITRQWFDEKDGYLLVAALNEIRSGGRIIATLGNDTVNTPEYMRR
jgi:hypothetical protein